MLPFLKRKETGIAGSIIEHRKPDDKSKQGDDEGYGLQACARDLIEAVHDRDEARVAKVLEDAFHILESQPHEESPLE